MALGRRLRFQDCQDVGPARVHAGRVSDQVEVGPIVVACFGPLVEPGGAVRSGALFCHLSLDIGRAPGVKSDTSYRPAAALDNRLFGFGVVTGGFPPLGKRLSYSSAFKSGRRPPGSREEAQLWNVASPRTRAKSGTLNAVHRENEVSDRMDATESGAASRVANKAGQGTSQFHLSNQALVSTHEFVGWQLQVRREASLGRQTRAEVCHSKGVRCDAAINIPQTPYGDGTRRCRPVNEPKRLELGRPVRERDMRALVLHQRQQEALLPNPVRDDLQGVRGPFFIP